MKSPSAGRPLFQVGIADLERKFAGDSTDANVLQQLANELQHRKTDRALRLQAKVADALERGGLAAAAPKAERVVATKTPAPTVGPATDVDDAPAEATVPPRGKAASPSRGASRRAKPSAENLPEEILRAWTALEVLTPQSYRRRSDLATLAGSDARDVVALERGKALPWQGEGQKSRPKMRLYYQVVLASIPLEPAIKGLIGCFPESKFRDQFPVRGEAVLATVLVDQKGRPADADSIAISSFAWGLPRAFEGDLAGLGDWSEAQRRLIGSLSEKLVLKDGDEIAALTFKQIQSATDWLVGELGISNAFVTREPFAIRCFQYYTLPDPPEPLILNSFYLEDLAAALALAQDGKLPPALMGYLGGGSGREKLDLLTDVAGLTRTVSPARSPSGRWPSGPKSLVVLQQAAVNLAASADAIEPLLAVNGPPGTGKSTLLRDIVANQVVSRARALASYPDPAAAFTHAGKVKAGQSWIHLYEVDPKIRGYEMIVASSNNKAVENISAELPSLEAVEGVSARYFKSTADALLERPCWGLVAAVLGNGANRSRFRRTFWFDEDLGLRTYLAEAGGTPQWIEVTDPKTGKVVDHREPTIVLEEKPPLGATEALHRWTKDRAHFLKLARGVDSRISDVEGAAKRARNLPEWEKRVAAAMSDNDAADKALAVASGRMEPFVGALSQQQEALQEADLLLKLHEQYRPGFWARLFRSRGFRLWRAEHFEKCAAWVVATSAEEAARQALDTAQGAVREASVMRTSTLQALDAAKREWHAMRALAEIERASLGARYLAADFAEKSHVERHLTVPWFSDELQGLRQDLFVAAMQLQRSFVDAAAKPLRHNIGALMMAFGGRGLGEERAALIPHLWTSLFLITPVVSTTFASVQRMLGTLPPESFGKLLIDEAGQALPQAAVGALMRARSAVVVGDPIQVEPVVTLPETLTGAICREFAVDPDLFNAPAASAQVLADRASPAVSEFETKVGSRPVGAPLLVHRRCSDPMFGISNAVAYGGLMVQAKKPRPSTIRDLLGPSRWLPVQSHSEEKWAPREGEIACELLQQLTALEAPPDIFFVTPFVIVAQRLREVILASRLLSAWPEIDPARWVRDRVGTIYTVQGREAEAVVLVLGAPDPKQTGARNWAGASPNQLNVAVSRAQEALYVVGNRDLWKTAGVFRELDRRLQ